jgi:thioredoxin-dependent peroxiredoxin
LALACGGRHVVPRPGWEVAKLAAILEGQEAPEFSLPASTGGEVALADYAGKRHVVLYFYPRDLTPGCTTEACSFRDLRGELEAAGAVILGVSTDDLRSHDRFALKHELNFPLLSDVGGVVARLYGVYKEKSMYGKTFLGINRMTFVIDKAGILRKVYPRVKVSQHADEVLAFVRGLS